MAAIFVSYRRTDSKHPTSRVHDRLRAEFGKDNVFKDVDNIPIGSDFRTVLRDVLTRCRVTLVMIGPGWVTAAEPDGTRRLTNPADFVRLELEATLARDIAVVPVLLDGAAMPRPADLPDSLQPICYRHAVTIGDDPHFDDDVARLIRGLKKILEAPPPPKLPTPPPPAPKATLPPPPPPPQPTKPVRLARQNHPTQSDYRDALRNPTAAFLDPDLRGATAERNPMGVPRARSGAFASVYKMTGPKGAVALKLFNFPNEDRAVRYRTVADHIRSLGTKKPPSLVGFEYHAEGIRVGDAWYPTLTMEWVKGVSLGEWVYQAIERKTPDTAAVSGMADSWVRLVRELQAARIAHGDLQHDNVIVTADNKLVLVDYDTVCVPALAGSDPLEFGKPAYQHPGRPNEKLGLDLDHFSAWVILIALRAVAADPQLYVRFIQKAENENLLFVPQDMHDPAKSELWPELLRSKDADVRTWAKALRESLDKPFGQIPPFDVRV
jgi:hypothetical protein